jgi:hypothetical protein
VTEPSGEARRNNRHSSPPGTDLAVSVVLLVWGLIFSYLPPKSRVPTWFDWSFEILAYVCYGVGLLALVAGINALFRSRFISYAGTGSLILVAAFYFQNWATGLQADSLALLVLYLFAIVTACLGTLLLAMAVPYLFADKKQGGMSPDGSDSTDQAGSAAQDRSRTENILAVVIAILTFLAALLPILQTWLGIE